MNIKTLTLVAALSLFATNTTTTNQANPNSVNLLNLTPLLCQECKDAEKEWYWFFPSEKVKACRELRKIDGAYITQAIERGITSSEGERVNNDILIPLQKIAHDFSPENKKLCLEELQTAVEQLKLTYELEKMGIPQTGIVLARSLVSCQKNINKWFQEK